MILHAVLSGFVLAFLAPTVHRLTRPLSGWVLALLPASIFAFFFLQIPGIAAGGVVREAIPWVSSFGVQLSFYLDGLSLVFALLISGIGTIIVIYTGGYLKGHPHQGRFYGFILAFMGSMLGLVLADNLITLFVFWELTSITSFLLIGFNHANAKARRSAIQALYVTAGGGLAMLGGLVLLGMASGTYEMSEILSNGSIADDALYVPIFILILAGAFTKSAQFPFHFWLPNAMEAPTPVSAFLHSATMVKAGVYLLARMHPVLGGTELWTTVLPIFGGITLIIGTILGLRQVDLKLMLAYTTVASLGLLVMLLGLGSEMAVEAAVIYLIAHSFFKGALFLVAGSVDHQTGTRETLGLGGLGGAMPITAFAAIFAALSMMGVPLFFGFIAKEVIYEATTHMDLATIITAVAVVGNALMLAIAAVVSIRPFYGPIVTTPKAPREGPPSIWLGPVLLGACGFLFGVWPELAATYFVSPMTGAITGHSAHVELHLAFVPGLPLILSGVTIIFGMICFWYSERIRKAANSLMGNWWGPDKGSDQFLAGLDRFSQWITGLIQRGKLRSYVVMTLSVLAITLGAPVLAFDMMPESFQFPEAPWRVYGVLALAVTGAFALMFARSRLQAILSMGVTGFSVALIFLLFGAPDLAFTQFMVETLSVVIIALVLLRLPVDTYDSRDALPSMRDAIIAIAVGASFTVLLIAITSGTLDLSLSTYFAENSYTQAHGRNIVNVILVDFRALDTLGEITVVMVAGLAALGLIKIRRGKLMAPKPPADQGDAK